MSRPVRSGSFRDSWIRELVCPTTAASLVLSLTTGAEAPFLAHYRPSGEPFPAQVKLPAGTYRVPTRVQGALRAVVLNHDHPEL